MYGFTGFFLALGVITVVPILLAVATQREFPSWISSVPTGKIPMVFFLILAALTLAGSAVGLYRSHNEYAQLLKAYREGHFTELTGTISNFQDDVSHRVDPGQFVLAGRTFDWAPQGLDQRFSSGMLRDGMRMRLRYMGDRIVHIELKTSELPPYLAAKASEFPVCKEPL